MNGQIKPLIEKETNVMVENVRTILVVKSREGKTHKDKALLNHFGAEKLSGVSKDKLANLKTKAEELCESYGYFKHPIILYKILILIIRMGSNSHCCMMKVITYYFASIRNLSIPIAKTADEIIKIIDALI